MFLPLIEIEPSIKAQLMETDKPPKLELVRILINKRGAYSMERVHLAPNKPLERTQQVEEIYPDMDGNSIKQSIRFKAPIVWIMEMIS